MALPNNNFGGFEGFSGLTTTNRPMVIPNPSVNSRALPEGRGSTGLFGDASLNQTGLNQIMQILRTQGQVPRDQLNRDISASNRAGQNVNQAITGNAAQRGLGNSGLVQALLAASGQATAGREAGLRAGFTSDAANRQRQDLINILLPLFGIQLDERSIHEDVTLGNRTRRDQRDAADKALMADIAGAGLSFATGGLL